jgi:hypothetical protein
MRCGAPGVTRQRFEPSDSVDASNRLVCTHRPNGYRAKCHCTVGTLQLAKCFRAVFKLDHCLVGWRSICSYLLLPIEYLDRGSLISGVWQRAHFTGYQDRVSHCIRA